MKILKRKGKKMKYLKPHFYDKFICTAGDCPDTCCAGSPEALLLTREGKEQLLSGTVKVPYIILKKSLASSWNTR